MITATHSAGLNIFSRLTVVSGGPSVQITLAAHLQATLPNFTISTTERELRGRPGKDADLPDMDLLAMYLLERG